VGEFAAYVLAQINGGIIGTWAAQRQRLPSWDGY